MILLIIMSLTFATVFSVVLYYNIAFDKTAFVNLFGEEPANVMIYAKPDTETNTSELLNHIQQMDQVRNVNIVDFISIKIDDHSVFTSVTENFNRLNCQIKRNTLPKKSS